MKQVFTSFNPVSLDFFVDKNKWETTQIGRSIDTHIIDSFPDLKFAEIAMFNIPEYEGSNNSASKSDCNVRASFYSFHHDNLPKIADLGIFQLMPTRKESFNIIQIVLSLIHICRCRRRG